MVPLKPGRASTAPVSGRTSEKPPPTQPFDDAAAAGLAGLNNESKTPATATAATPALVMLAL
jgi:hypothetical protein